MQYEYEYDGYFHRCRSILRILVALGRWRLGFGLGFDALLVVLVEGAEVPIALRTLRLDPLEDTSPLELVC